jgi:hypothetical protein
MRKVGLLATALDLITMPIFGATSISFFDEYSGKTTPQIRNKDYIRLR